MALPFSDMQADRFKNLLWVDCSAGAVVGIAVLALHRLLSVWYGLPEDVLLFTGIANIVYAIYSFSLAIRKKRGKRLVSLLAMANMAWAPVCVYLAFSYGATANLFGLGHLLLEAVFVGGLGYTEWKVRDLLVR